MFGRYVNFPLTPEEEKAVGEEVAELAAAQSAMMLTLEARNSHILRPGHKRRRQAVHGR